MIRRRTRAGIALLLAALSGCGGQAQDPPPAPAALPVVTDARDDLVLSWFADGGPRTASSVAEVPAEARREVRVQDPRIPPEERDPDLVFLADLSRPGADGRFPVRTVSRSEHERSLPRAPESAPPAIPAAAPGADGAPVPVVMYATAHCPVCQKARRFLLEAGIPYRERDVEKDQAAARDLAEKGQAQGVSTGGVPIFEIGGRLLAGFDQTALLAALRPASGAATP